MSSIFQKCNIEEKRMYIDLLRTVGSLSNLFSEGNIPYLYYRAMEKAFVKAFNATDYSRSDISADVGKDGLGIGLKTFLHSNGKTLQKIAEFNRESPSLRNMSTSELVRAVSSMRNDRIDTAKAICELDQMAYHIVTRKRHYMAIYEEPMDYIQIEKIAVIRDTHSSITFEDGLNEYNFNMSKSTLYKRFLTSDNNMVAGFDIYILEDPFEFLLANVSEVLQHDADRAIDGIISPPTDQLIDCIVLPLYSPRDGSVAEKSGLNQWNAGGRKRDINEVYIPIPSWIHGASSIFDYNTNDNKTAPFKVRLPSGKFLSMRVAQQGGKALMSDPNAALGQWLLRDVLKLPEGKLVTREKLDHIGIDSVQLSKFEDGLYTIDFLKSGSFDAYQKEQQSL